LTRQARRKQKKPPGTGGLFDETNPQVTNLFKE